MLCAPFLALALVAPPPKGENTGYYPTKVGTKFTHATPGGDAVSVVMGVENKDGAKIVTIGRIRDDGQHVPVEKVQVTEKGVAQLGTFPTVVWVGIGPAPKGPAMQPQWTPHENPLILLDLTAKAGKWEYQTPDAKVTFSVGKEELVKVPAGEFRALPVHGVRKLPDGTEQQFCHWYAHGVGAVKWTYGKNEPIVLKSISHDKK